MADAPGPKKHRGIRGRLKEIKEFFKGSGSNPPRSESPSLVRNVEESAGPSARNQPEQGAESSSIRGRSAQDPLEVAPNSLSPPQLTSDGPQEETEQPIEDPRDDNVPDVVAPPLSPEGDTSVPPKGIGSKVYEGLKATLRLVVEVSDVFPPVQSTAAGLLFIFDLIDAYGENHEAFDKLLERVKVLSAILASCPKDVPEEVLVRFRGLSLTMREKEQLLKQKLENRSKVERVILSAQDKDEVIELTQEISMIIEIAVFTSVTQNEFRTIQAVSEIKWLKEHVTIIEQASGGLRDVEKDIEFLRKSELLRKLGEVEGAEYDNQKCGGGCTPGTRISLLATLLIWAMDRDSAHLFWLSGPAGTGKTALSKTFCAQLAQRGTYGASFMCTVQKKDRQDVYLIIPTVAKILAEERPVFGKALEQVLLNDRSCRSPKTMSLNDQYSKLILEPAAKVFTADDLLVICIDALDECKDKDAISQLVTTLLRKPTVPLKFFLTSRPETSLRTSLQSSGKQLHLYDIEEHVVKADVMLFLTEQFRAVRAIYEAHKDTWPPPEIEAIADCSGKLFIVAFTAFKYITAPNGICLERFKDFAQRPSGLGASAVDVLYEGIMTEAFKGLEPREQHLVHSCLSLLVVAQKPLSPFDYGRLLNKDTSLIREAFKALHSVVQVPEEGVGDASISIYHASFVDYVTSDTQREQKWAVEKAIAHAETGDACFRIMDLMLCFGISGAPTSYLSNDEQPTPLKLSSELGYACSAWGDHAIYAGLESEPRQQKVKAFLKGEKFWYWLEALSTVKAVKYGYTILWKISKVDHEQDAIIRLHNAMYTTTEALPRLRSSFATPSARGRIYLEVENLSSAMSICRSFFGIKHWTAKRIGEEEYLRLLDHNDTSFQFAPSFTCRPNTWIRLKGYPHHGHLALVKKVLRDQPSNIEVYVVPVPLKDGSRKRKASQETHLLHLHDAKEVFGEDKVEETGCEEFVAQDSSQRRVFKRGLEVLAYVDYIPSVARPTRKEFETFASTSLIPSGLYDATYIQLFAPWTPGERFVAFAGTYVGISGWVLAVGEDEIQGRWEMDGAVHVQWISQFEVKRLFLLGDNVAINGGSLEGNVGLVTGFNTEGDVMLSFDITGKSHAFPGRMLTRIDPCDPGLEDPEVVLNKDVPRISSTYWRLHGLRVSMAQAQHMKGYMGTVKDVREDRTATVELDAYSVSSKKTAACPLSRLVTYGESGWVSMALLAEDVEKNAWVHKPVDPPEHLVPLPQRPATPPPPVPSTSEGRLSPAWNPSSGTVKLATHMKTWFPLMKKRHPASAALPFACLAQLEGSSDYVRCKVTGWNEDGKIFVSHENAPAQEIDLDEVIPRRPYTSTFLAVVTNPDHHMFGEQVEIKETAWDKEGVNLMCTLYRPAKNGWEPFLILMPFRLVMDEHSATTPFGHRLYTAANLPEDESIASRRFRNVSVITARNVHKDASNDFGIKRFPEETGQTLPDSGQLLLRPHLVFY
ncbi:hypothetical protein DFP72DRAFT_1074546 [Ephemerocybe angulata]|uniref:Nephrocystin 3-like N-terminal domain-containing protein n=1 Tax=Ephemerocybe angulata TaxID=980116 RepID=A0A8H6HKZ0_9AGAR|nr:hypothetical protein DFP72DRAFT_1074546 [Tulosesus angulatus]